MLVSTSTCAGQHVSESLLGASPVYHPRAEAERVLLSVPPSDPTERERERDAGWLIAQKLTLQVDLLRGRAQKESLKGAGDRM